MDVLRVFNNNVVLARGDDGGEVIVTGRGVGFQARPGTRVVPEQVARVFVPADGRDPDHLAELLADIPPEYVALVTAALNSAGLGERARSSPTLVISLADHVTFAVRRAADGTSVEYPLTAEVKHLYAAEYEAGRTLLAALNERLDEPLPAGEAIAFSLHLINAGFATGDLSYTYTMTGIIQQLLAIISQHYGIELDHTSVNVGRFITHLRYLFVRIHQNEQLDQEHAQLADPIRQAFPEALACSRRLAATLELRLGAELTEDEISYLTLHVARVAAD